MKSRSLQQPFSNTQTQIQSIWIKDKNSNLKILILTPLSLERDAVLRHLENVQYDQEAGRLYFTGQFQGQYQSFDITILETGSKNSVVALAAEQAIQYSKPLMVILTGIAGGVKDVKIGDVVIGEKAYGYDSGKETDSGFVYRPHVHPFSKPLLALAKIVELLNKWPKRLDSPASEKVFFGPIASGDKVVASKGSEAYHKIKNHLNDTIALEMESAGFGEALSNHPHLLSINIRGISDLLDKKSEGDEGLRQRTAAANAAAFIFEMLNQLEPKKVLKDIANAGEEASKIIDIDAATSNHGKQLATTELSTLKNQVAQNKIKPALKTLLSHTAHDGDLQNQIILLTSRWNQLQREKNMNIISRGHAQVEFNRIRAALLDTIDEMESES